ncbi:MAG: hypothetical protein WAL84_02295 [Candidatus Dormiibacterota bacterium]
MIHEPLIREPLLERPDEVGDAIRVGVMTHKQLAEAIRDHYGIALSTAYDHLRPLEHLRDRRAATEPSPTSYKCSVHTMDDRPEVYTSNGLRFASEADANAYGSELHSRWMAMTGWKVEPSEDAVNATVDEAGHARLAATIHAGTGS